MIEFPIRKCEGKPRPSSLDWDFVNEIMVHLQKSNQKYPDVNGKPNYWREFDSLIQQVLNSLTRHTIALNRGEYLDQESGTPHHVCIASNCMILNKHATKFQEELSQYHQ